MVGERLAEIRKDHGDRQIDLAAKLNVSKETIKSWEHENSSPSHSDLVTICRLYHVSADYLLGLTDDDPLFGEKRREARFTPEERAEIRAFEEFLLYKRKK